MVHLRSNDRRSTLNAQSSPLYAQISNLLYAHILNSSFINVTASASVTMKVFSDFCQPFSTVR